MLANKKIVSATCLIVPGRSWNKKQIEQLHYLQNCGFDLAGHGWNHRARSKKNAYHYFHSLIMSRNVAEHLSLSSKEIIQLMFKCAKWFDENDLNAPYVYIPPAWALGNVTWEDLSVLPYKLYETLSGVYHNGEFHTLPLVGYEADNLIRIIAVKGLNKMNRIYSKIKNTPLRVSIHPNDLELGLGNDLNRILSMNPKIFSYRDYFEKVK